MVDEEWLADPDVDEPPWETARDPAWPGWSDWEAGSGLRHVTMLVDVRDEAWQAAGAPRDEWPEDLSPGSAGAGIP